MLSHRSSSVLQTCVARTLDLITRSICQRDQTTLRVEDGDAKVFLRMAKKVMKRIMKELSSNQSAPAGSTK